MPYQVDNITMLVELATEESAIHYYYEVSGAHLSSDEQDDFDKSIKAAACDSNAISDFMKRGAQIIHSYKFSDGGVYVLKFSKLRC